MPDRNHHGTHQFIQRPFELLDRVGSNCQSQGRLIQVDWRNLEIPLTHYVVPLENRAGLVTCHLHRHTLGNSGPHQIPEGCSPEVAGNSPRHSRTFARRQPRTPETFNLLPFPVEHPGANLPLLLDGVRVLPLIPQSLG
mgnify:CR=1 FL=1